MAGPRIVSLLPSATEIVYALGLEHCLVGVTHECDFPLDATTRPHVTRSTIDSETFTSRQIDLAVRESLEEQSTIYHLDRDLLEELRPDIILTQELCDVCAVGTDEVKRVVESLSHTAQVVSLEPRTLEDVFETILTVGDLAGAGERSRQLVDSLRDRVAEVRRVVAGRPVLPVLTLEWLDPVFVGGHWVPEMVSLAGGRDVLGVAGQPSREASWDVVAESSPEVVVAMPCGFGLERSCAELREIEMPAAWHAMDAVREGNVFVVDGSSYFNRPGPRLVDGVEILAAILHPDVWNQAPGASFRRMLPMEERARATSPFR